MAEVVIREKLWKDLVAIARRRRQHAEKLAERVLREFVQRAADEELLKRSERYARRAKFRLEDTEAIIKRTRQKRRLS